MLETVYKTPTPEKGKSECYEISVNPVEGTGLYAFREDHGWWDDPSKAFVHHITTINTVEAAVTLDEAQSMYEQAKAQLARNGFVHSFSPDYYYGNKPYEYRKIEIGFDYVIDRYNTLELELPGEPDSQDSPVRCIATNTNDHSVAEAWLNLVQTNALLSFLYGSEVSIVDTFMRQLSDYRYAELIAQPGGRFGDRCVVTSEELLRFGFNRDELRPWRK